MPTKIQDFNELLEILRKFESRKPLFHPPFPLPFDDEEDLLRPKTKHNNEADSVSYASSHTAITTETVGSHNANLESNLSKHDH